MGRRIFDNDFNYLIGPMGSIGVGPSSRAGQVAGDATRNRLPGIRLVAGGNRGLPLSPCGRREAALAINMAVGSDQCASRCPACSLTFGNFAGRFVCCGPAVVVWGSWGGAFIDFRGRLIATAGAVRVPSAIPRLRKTVFPGNRGIGEYLGVEGRINTVQAARLHISALVFVVVAAGLRPSRRSRTECAQADGCRQRDERRLYAHGRLPSVSLMIPAES
jgi:hypothetical protein